MGIQGLDFQNVEVRFTGGIDTRTDPKLVIPGKWRTLQNVSLTDDGTPKLRDGVALLATQTGNGLLTWNDQLLAVSGPALTSYSQQESAFGAAAGGTPGYVDVSKRDVWRLSANFDSPDCAIGGGYICYAVRITTTAGVQACSAVLYDATTGALMAAGTIAAGTSICPRVVYDGGAFFCLAMDNANHLRCLVIDVSGVGPVVGAPVTIVNNAQLAFSQFDACQAGAVGTGQVCVVVRWTGGTNSVQAFNVVRTGTVPSNVSSCVVLTEAQAATATISALACCPISATSIGCFAMYNGAPGKVLGGLLTPIGWTMASTNLLIESLATQGPGSNLTACVTGSVVHVVYDQMGAYGTNSINPIHDAKCTTALAVTTIVNLGNSASGSGGASLPRPPQGPWIWGKAFNDGVSTYLPMVVWENYGAVGTGVNQSNQQNTFFLMDVDKATVAAKALYGSSGVPNGYATGGIGAGPASVVALGGGSFLVPGLEWENLSLNNGRNTTMVGLCALTMTPRKTSGAVSAQLGQSTFLAGGVLSMYDGTNMTEAGFHLFPEGLYGVIAAGGAADIGVHQFVCVYEWQDSAGQRHQSSPSPAVSVTATGGNQTINVQCPTLLLTQRSVTTGLSVVLYGTAAAGLTFYRIASVPNDKTVTNVTLTLATADATFTSNELLYSQPNQAGSALPNDAPAPCTALCIHQGRLFLNASDEPGVFRYSQPRVAGFGLQFNEALQGTVPTEAGNIVALAEMDEKVLIFCERKIYAIFGTGPTTSGAYNNYSDPIEVPGDVGCSDVRSILKPTGGVIFKSAIGWHEVGRDLTVRYIGEAVKAYDAQAVKASVLVADRKEARFECSEVTLVYSYLYGQWSTFSYIDHEFNPNGSTPIVAADALYWTKGKSYVRIMRPASGYAPGVYRDVPGQQYDSIAGVVTLPTIIMQTSWLKLAHLSDFQRIAWLYVTMTQPSAIDSKMSLAVDYDDGDNQSAPGSYTLSALDISALVPVGSSVDFRHKLRRQKCKSVSFTLSFNPAGSPTAIVLPSGLQGLILRTGFKRGTNKLPATNAVG